MTRRGAAAEIDGSHIINETSEHPLMPLIERAG